MKRSYAYLIACAAVAAAVSGFAVAQQKNTSGGKVLDAQVGQDVAASGEGAKDAKNTTKEPVTSGAANADAAKTATAATGTTAGTTTTAVFDIKSVANMPIGLERGKAIAQGVCASCHTATGNSTIPANPILAGQHEAYIIKQLYDFKPAEEGKTALRVNASMSGTVAGLSADPEGYEKDVKSLAMWFTGQTMTPDKATIDDATMSKLGETLYVVGNKSKNLPACIACHGPTGAGIPAKYPRLGGQHSAYLETQMKAFRDYSLEGGRNNSPAGQMSDIAMKMTDTEIKAVVDYIAGLR